MEHHERCSDGSLGGHRIAAVVAVDHIVATEPDHVEAIGVGSNSVRFCKPTQLDWETDQRVAGARVADSVTAPPTQRVT